MAKITPGMGDAVEQAKVITKVCFVNRLHFLHINCYLAMRRLRHIGNTHGMVSNDTDLA